MGINTFLFITAVVAANIVILLLNSNCRHLARYIEILERRTKMLEDDVQFLTEKLADHMVQQLSGKERNEREKEENQ